MSTVYVVNEPYYRHPAGGRPFDFSAALKYGGLMKVLPPGRPPWVGEALVSRVRDAMAGFAEDDYLLPIGDPVAVSVAAVAAADMTGGRVKVLRWESETREYTVMDLDLSPEG